MDIIMKRLCSICARGGSKGVKNKNIRPIAGKPLIAHSIHHALESGLFDLLAVSSDSEAILEVAREAGAQLLVRRPDELATDYADKLSTIMHCVLQAERHAGMAFDTLVDLDATSPLRAVADVHVAVAILEEGGFSSVITGAPARRSPYFNLVEMDKEGVVSLSKRGISPVVRRQDAPPCYDMNASVYVWNRERFVASPALFYSDSHIHVMPDERSHDIDTEIDFRIVELLFDLRATKQNQ
jgi:N-acylneuraminate cytidylyltransferase/CMP-N,N'-diacetyllegionaminic acid synthase